jgi:transcriptional regulator with XRE-family HTH domain
MAKGKYDEWLSPEGLLLIEGWARDGLTEEQISENIGISRSTLSEWKKKYSDISNALKRGKEVIDRMVENALLKAALGYDYEEDGLTKDGDVISLRKVSHPNTTALIFWLKNRKPEKWRDKQEHHLEGTVGVQIVDDIE